MVNTLCNIIFTGASSLLIICVGWFVTEKIVEPRLKQVPLNEDLESADEMGRYSAQESRAFNWAWRPWCCWGWRWPPATRRCGHRTVPSPLSPHR